MSNWNKNSQNNVMPEMASILVSAMQFYANLGYSTPLNASLDPTSWFHDRVLYGSW